MKEGKIFQPETNTNKKNIKVQEFIKTRGKKSWADTQREGGLDNSMTCNKVTDEKVTDSNIKYSKWGNLLENISKHGKAMG